MTKTFYNEVYSRGHSSRYDGGDTGFTERARKLLNQTDAWLTKTGLKLNSKAKILEIGPGMSLLSKVHPGWIGAEYSKSAIERVKDRDGPSVPIFEEDAQNLSFQDGEFDGIFSWAALEHVPDPNKAFCEIDRVLRLGGHALIAPAWNCRPWTVKKLLQRPWNTLSLLERIERLSIPFRNNIAYRAALAFPRRVMRECRWLARSDNIKLSFKTLRPRWDLIEEYGHVSDDDAVADIDPHSAVLFFLSRRYSVTSHPSFITRILARHEPVLVQKGVAT